LIKKKIIPVNEHLSADGMIATDPYVCLLCNGRIKEPTCAVFTDQLRKGRRVAIFLAERVRFFMLGLEVEYVDSKANAGKEGI